MNGALGIRADPLNRLPPPQGAVGSSLWHVCAPLFVSAWHKKTVLQPGETFFFYKEKKQQHLKHDEMWELNSEKRNHDGNDSMAAAVCVGCESVMSGLKWRKGQLARPSRVFGITK